MRSTGNLRRESARNPRLYPLLLLAFLTLATSACPRTIPTIGQTSKPAWSGNLEDLPAPADPSWTDRSTRANADVQRHRRESAPRLEALRSELASLEQRRSHNNEMLFAAMEGKHHPDHAFSDDPEKNQAIHERNDKSLGDRIRKTLAEIDKIGFQGERYDRIFNEARARDQQEYEESQDRLQRIAEMNERERLREQQEGEYSAALSEALARDAAKDSARRGARQRTPTGAMPTGAHAHRPAAPAPAAHIHH